MTTVEHGFNLDAIRRELDREDWEDDPENPGTQIRRLYLGSVFSLTPSGKMYAPFACSNLTPCPTCKGTGRIVPRRYKRRTQKKHIARHAYVQRRFDALYGGEPGVYAHAGASDEGRGGTPSLGRPWHPTNKRAAFAFIDRQPKRYRMRGFLPGSSCTACNGYGSREAWLDELWQEAAEEGIAQTPKGDEGDGVFLSWEDGDAFACETRDAPEDEEDEEDGGDEEGDVDTEATEGDVGF
jgi:hypothetical protein